MCCMRDVQKSFEVGEAKRLLPLNRVCTDFLGSTYGGLDKGMGSISVELRVDVFEKVSRA